MAPASRSRLQTAALAWNLALAALLGSCSDAPTPAEPGARLLIVGWDGASFRMVDALLAQGRLPNLARLRERGLDATLESTAVPISSAAWTSAFTGKGPGETGVYGFFEPVLGTYDVRLVNAGSNRAAPLWRLLSARGRHSVVFGVPLTYPPEPLLGTLVSGMLSPFEADYAWPPGYADELRARGFEPDLETWTEVRDVDWEGLDRQLTLKREILGELLGQDPELLGQDPELLGQDPELLGQDPWDLGVVVFKSLDVFSHRAYGVDFETFVAPVYERLDAILGQLVKSVGPETDVMVLSDHGFRTYSSGLNLHAWLVREGFTVLAQPQSVIQIDPEQTLERREQAAIRALRQAVEWAGTRAFVQVTEGNYGALRVNRAGREPQGRISDEELPGLLEELESALLRLRDPRGEKLVTRVFRTEELYPGPAADLLPDLILETREDVQVFAEEGSTRVFGAYSEPLPDHDRFGILVAAGPSFARLPERGRLELADIAPTALHLLGEAVPEEMSGAVGTWLLRSREPVRRVPEGSLGIEGTHPADRPFSALELEELRGRLGPLGYGR